MAGLLREIATGAPNIGVITLISVLILVLVGLIGPLRSIRDFTLEIVQLDTGALLQGQLADRAATLTPEEIASEDLDSQIEGHSRAIVDHISRTYADALLAFEAILGAGGLVFTIARYSPIASVLTALSLIPTLLIGFYLSKSQKRMWLQLGRVYRRERYVRELLSSRSALLELTAFGTMDRIADLEKRAQAKICTVRKEPVYAGIKVTVIATLANAVLFSGAIMVLFWDVGFKSTTVAAVYGVFGAVNAIAQGGSQISKLVQYAPTVRSLIEFLARPIPVSSEPADWDGTVIDRIDLNAIEVAYADHKNAVDGVSLHVSRGEMVAIVGKNGAGKTTLLNALLGLIPLTGGSFSVNGRHVIPAAQEWWLSRFGAMAQDFGKYEVTVSESVRLGRSGVVDSKSVGAALSAARAKSFVDRLPGIEETQLGEVWGGVGLSGGQWQRLALSRVYLRNAQVWILDEPSSAIDAETEVELFDELRRTSVDRSTLIVSHRAWTLKRMDRIYVMHEGKIVEAGKFDELLEMNGHFARLFREQTLSNPT